MLDTAHVDFLATQEADHEWQELSQNERRLIQGYRQMTEQERRHVRRLITQLAYHSDNQVE